MRNFQARGRAWTLTDWCIQVNEGSTERQKKPILAFGIDFLLGTACLLFLIDLLRLQRRLKEFHFLAASRQLPDDIKREMGKIKSRSIQSYLIIPWDI